MNEVDILSHYVTVIARLISEKYGIEPFVAMRQFLKSKTWQMLEAPELEMWEYTPDVIFEMWECERLTGDPRNSIYLRSDV